MIGGCWRILVYGVLGDQVDLVSDLYIKELKAFKPTPLSSADAQSSTKPWTVPSPAKAPALEGDAAEALSEYDTAAVETVSGSSEAAVVEEEDWFVFEEEEEHHH
ncbi:unnamed protein product [Kuraishia capsulata CBS 1993]|uniref:ATP synthase subunit H, mitochondrial n=1 Tax=Kuraishia capsulata CBS 1993 TaxID=1382522 RepID=W6MNL5_9ASCO|nr:uncharacterized protein KUCA_T00003847001 [Kuraishia capsulata CBS 1993]CDK27868.1 unnamed protein product [Kuraishia capsulata CBS 1993]